MGELVKKWNDGGSLSVTYDGDGDGTAVFSSDVNEGLDREMSVLFKVKGIEVERNVFQEGLRENFNDDFVLSDGGTFNVLKEMKPYTRLDYIETTGTQWIDSGISAPLTADVRLQGVDGSSTTHVAVSMGGKFSGGSWFGYAQVWTVGGGGNFDIAYNETIDARCSFTSSGVSVSAGDVVKTRSGSVSGSLCIGSSSSLYPASCRIFGARIYNDKEVLVMDLIPVLDKSDVPCMYDLISEQFLYNQGKNNFIAGNKQ